MNMGERIRTARKIAGLTQTELSEKVGISQQGINRLEVGKVRVSNHIVEIAVELDVAPEWLVYGPDEPIVNNAFNGKYKGLAINWRNVGN